MNNEISQINHNTAENLLFSYVLNLWLSVNEVKIKRATYDKYSYIIEKHISPKLGSMEINKINSHTINIFLKEKLTCGSIDEHSVLSPSYVNTMAVIIKAALDYATNENIYSGLKNPIYKPQHQTQEFTILNSDEIKQLEEFIDNNLGCDEMGVALALNMGLRIGEICALSWENIDFQNRIIHIKSTVSRVKENGKCTNIIGTPKTISSVRDIPIPNKVYKQLKRLYKSNKSKYVISEKESFICPRTYEYRYHRIMSKADIKSINFHSLRHTFATNCIINGMDVKSLSEILGHSNTSITMQRYVHPSMEMKRKQLEKVIN